MASWSGDRLELSFEGVEELEIRIVGGEATVTATEGETTRLEAEVVDGPAIEVSYTAGTLTVEHRQARSFAGLVFGGGAKALVTVMVPAGVVVNVRTVSADAFVAGMSESATVHTVSGRLTATGLAGDIALRTVSGELELEGADGEISVQTVSGDATVTGVDPSSLVARSVSGDVTIDCDHAGEVECVTVSGDVAVRLPNDATFTVDATTVSGHLDTTFPQDDIEIGRRRMRGSVGRGGDRIRLVTTSGSATVLRRDGSRPDVEQFATDAGGGR